MNPFEELSNAIIIHAAKDYRKALKRLKKCPWDTTAKQMKKECEKFFRSSWYRHLTSVDGDLIIQKIQAEVNI